MSENTILGIGSRVKHPAYGDGVIISVDVAAYKCCFMQYGLKHVGKEYAAWEIIEAIELLKFHSLKQRNLWQKSSEHGWVSQRKQNWEINGTME